MCWLCRYGGFSLGARSSQVLPSVQQVNKTVREIRAYLQLTEVGAPVTVEESSNDPQYSILTLSQIERCLSMVANKSKIHLAHFTRLRPYWPPLTCASVSLLCSPGEFSGQTAGKPHQVHNWPGDTEHCEGERRGERGGRERGIAFSFFSMRFCTSRG